MSISATTPAPSLRCLTAAASSRPAFIGDTLTRADSIALEHNWTLSSNKVNQLRFGYTRRGFRSGCVANRPACVAGIRNSQHPASAFSDTLPTYDVVGFQQLGPPANGNAEFTTSVTQFVDNLLMAARPSQHEDGRGLAHRASRCPAAAQSDRFFPVHQHFDQQPVADRSAGGRNGKCVRIVPAGPGAELLDRRAACEVLKPRAKIAEFFFQDDFKATARLASEPGCPLYVEFSIHGGGRSGRRVQSADPDSSTSLDRAAQSRAARNLEKLNFAPRVGLAFRLTDSFIVRSGYGMTWIEQAGITTPFTTPLFPFIQTAGQRSLDNINPAFVLSAGPSVQVMDPNPDSGLGQGVFAVERNQKSGYAQQWNLSFQKTFGRDWSAEVGYLGSKLTNLGVPDVNLNQLTAEQLAIGLSPTSLTQQVPNPYFGQIPPSSSLGGPTIARQQLLRPYPALYNGCVLSQQRRPLDLSFLPDAPGAAFFGRPDLHRRLHLFKADRRRRRGV